MPDLLQEDRGLIKVHSICVEMHAIWRPTPCHDIGIDGQIEFLEIEESIISTGQIVALQVKSGPSFFQHKQKSAFAYYPSAKHFRYWSALNIPVLLVLHNPVEDLTIYADVKSQLQGKGPIMVQESSIFSCTSRPTLLELCGRIENPERVLGKLKSIKLTIGLDKEISGIEFLTSCLSPSHEYFELRMARFTAIIDFAVDVVCIGSDVYEFIHRCSLVCMGAGITENFTEIYEHQWYEMGLVPDITIALTPFGIAVANFLKENSTDYIESTPFRDRGSNDSTQLFEELQKLSQWAADYLDQDALGFPGGKVIQSYQEFSPDS